MPPDRIQLHRTKGWRLPPSAVKVDRTTRWGNPFRVEGYGRHGALALHRQWLDGAGPDQIRHGRIVYSRSWVRTHLPELAGKTLACWCRPDQPCHGDRLRALADGAAPIPDAPGRGVNR